MVMEFDKLPSLPKGSDAFQSVIDEIEREQHIEPETVIQCELLSPRSDTQSGTKAPPSSARMAWLSTRARHGKQSFFKAVTLARYHRR